MRPPGPPTQPKARAKGSWTFYDDPDMARVLREAREAGFELIEVRHKGDRTLFATLAYVKRCNDVCICLCYNFVADDSSLLVSWNQPNNLDIVKITSIGWVTRDPVRVNPNFTAKQLHAELLRREAVRKRNRCTVVGYA
jgi:hypothetical protein